MELTALLPAVLLVLVEGLLGGTPNQILLLFFAFYCRGSFSLTGFCWSGWTFIHQNRHLHHSMLFVAARMLGGFVCMCFFGMITPGIRLRQPTMAELRDILVLATVGITMSETLYQWGMATTSPAFAATYEATLPLFTIGLAWFCNQEKLSITAAFNIVCAALGTVFLVQKTPQFSKAPPSDDRHAIPAKHFGHIMLIASYAFKAAFLILLRRFHRRFSQQDGRDSMGPYCLTLWAYFVAMLQVVIALLVNSQMRQAVDVGLNSGPELIYGMICISAMCPIIITWANMCLSRSTSVAIFACAHPLFVMIMSWLFKGTAPNNPFQVVGAVLVMVGIYR
jgi:drug/metabolite transporter (DMT)-like permease